MNISLSLRWILLGLLGIVGLLLTWFDGYGRAIDQGMVDFNILYAGAELFSKGENPYFSALLSDVLVDANVKAVWGVQSTLPGVFGVLYPLSLLDHDAASLLWMVLNGIGILGSLFVLLQLTGLRLKSFPGSLLMVCGLLVGAFRMGVRQGQLDNMVLLLVLVAILIIPLSRRSVVSGFILGIAITLKPTSAGLFSIYWFFRGRLLGSLTALFISAGIMIVCAMVLSHNTPEWIHVWGEVRASAESAFNQVGNQNPRLELLTHLPAGLFRATGSTQVAYGVSYLVCIFILLRTLFSRPILSTPDGSADLYSYREHHLRELSIIALIGLLIVYHRFYSAVFLVLPLAWAVYLISNRAGNMKAWLVLVSIPLFSLVNGQAAYVWLMSKKLIPGLMGTTWIESTLLQFHFVWFQLALLIILFLDQLRKTEFSTAVFLDGFRGLLPLFGRKSDSNNYAAGSIDDKAVS